MSVVCAAFPGVLRLHEPVFLPGYSNNQQGAHHLPMAEQKLYFKLQLECGHDILFHPVRSEPLQPWHLCRTCAFQIAIYAVECREWHARCRNCRYSRWFGQSGPECESAGNRHARSRPEHIVNVKYELHPDKFQYVREHLGRKARVIVDGAPKLRVVIRHNPEEEECPF